MGLACGGTIRIFVEKIDRTRQARAASARRRYPSAPHGGAGDATCDRRARLAHSPDELGPDLAPALDEAFRRDRSAAVEGATARSSSTCSIPTMRLIIVGAVHVAQPLVPMARALGYDVMIVDPRSAFATKERFGDVEIVRDWPDEALPSIGMDGRTALIALTHDPKIDDPALICRACLRCVLCRGAWAARRPTPSASSDC